jgi:hypothetical protein
MLYAHSLTAVNRRIKGVGYSFNAPPGWSLSQSGFNARGHAEVTLHYRGEFAPDLTLPDGWEVAGWFRNPVKPAADSETENGRAFGLGCGVGVIVGATTATLIFITLRLILGSP